jgi:hypothetical protein
MNVRTFPPKNSYTREFILKYEFMDMTSKKHAPIFEECHSLYKKQNKKAKFPRYSTVLNTTRYSTVLNTTY